MYLLMNRLNSYSLLLIALLENFGAQWKSINISFWRLQERQTKTSIYHTQKGSEL